MKEKVAAIIVAGGSGSRFETATPKQFMELACKPLLAHTVARFEGCAAIHEIVLVLPRLGFDDHKKLMANWISGSKPTTMVPGGEERQHSTANGLAELPTTFQGLVAVHDGARPLVSGEVIRAVVEAAESVGGALAGLPVYETLKEVGENDVVQGTVDRGRLFRAQTPQCFRFEILRAALDKARRDGFVGTDEAQLVERLGGVDVRIVLGTETNLKVTTIQDMVLAEHYLKAET